MYPKQVFLDATSSLDQFSFSTFILSTGSAAGVIPLGYLLFLMSQHLLLLLALISVMLSGAFYGHGCDTGPELILTDEQVAQHEAFRLVWPGTRQLSCLIPLFAKVVAMVTGKKARD